MTEAEWQRWPTVWMRSSVLYPLIGARLIGPPLQMLLAWLILRRIERFQARQEAGAWQR